LEAIKAFAKREKEQKRRCGLLKREADLARRRYSFAWERQKEI
jgi:hypothetical protein